MNIVHYVQKAITGIVQEPITVQDTRKINKEKSGKFVEHLATLLRESFKKNSNIAVLSKDFCKNRSRFGLNELLYDILVCETQTILSPIQRQELTYIKKGIWAIESEFARDMRKVLFDFNKLVLSSSENVAFIGAVPRDSEKFLQVLGEVAAKCSAKKVYAILVSHPSDWGKNSQTYIKGYNLDKDRWIPYKSND